ncbi:MAG: hypothetical protein JNK05_20835 [Myxococcales bacterium]|nr:hypothetical protein [Myxococcales bacterium]
MGFVDELRALSEQVKRRLANVKSEEATKQALIPSPNQSTKSRMIVPMKYRTFLAAATLVLAAPGSLAQSLTPVSSTHSNTPAPTAREDLLARAPTGISEHDLGAYFNTAFRPLSGASVITEQQRSALRRTTTNERSHTFRVVSSEQELRANASIWGIVSGQVTATSASHHGYFRAYEIDGILQIPATFSLGQAPTGAAWYISAIFYGRMVETHVSSSDSSRVASLGARWNALSGSVSTSLTSMGIASQTHVLGLNATGAEHLFVHDATELARVYARGESVPILVRYSRVSATHATAVAAGTPLRVIVEYVRYPRQNQRRRTAWDVFNGPPDIQFNVHRRDNSELRTRPQCTVDSFECRPVGDAAVAHPSMSASVDNPIVFTFWDVDPMAPDYGGDIVVDQLPAPGQSRDYIGYGIELRLRTELPH